jgi:hypothetical protein
MVHKTSTPITVVNGCVYLTEASAAHFHQLAGQPPIVGATVNEWRAFVSLLIHQTADKGQFHTIFANLLHVYLPKPTNAVERLSGEIDKAHARGALRNACHGFHDVTAPSACTQDEDKVLH